MVLCEVDWEEKVMSLESALHRLCVIHHINTFFGHMTQCFEVAVSTVVEIGAYVAFSRVEDNFANRSVPTGYKVKSREGCVHPMSLSKCQGVRTQANTVLPGRVGTIPTENRARPAHGQSPPFPCCCVGSLLWGEV